jgi:hypothetical protein
MESKRKKPGALVKKKIEELKNPDLMIKVNYKNKKLSIPLSNLEEQGLSEILTPHIVRFEREILSTQPLMQRTPSLQLAALRGGEQSPPAMCSRTTTFRPTNRCVVLRGRWWKSSPYGGSPASSKSNLLISRSSSALVQEGSQGCSSPGTTTPANSTH